MLRHGLPFHWFLFLLLALTLAENLAYKSPASPLQIQLSLETLISSPIANSSSDSNPGQYFSPDLINEGVDKCQLSLIAHHLSVKQFNESDIKNGLVGYFGDAATFKVEKIGKGFFHICFDDMVLLTKALSLSPLFIRNRWLQFQLWIHYVEPMLDLFSYEDVVVQAHDLSPEWKTP